MPFLCNNCYLVYCSLHPCIQWWNCHTTTIVIINMASTIHCRQIKWPTEIRRVSSVHSNCGIWALPCGMIIECDVRKVFFSIVDVEDDKFCFDYDIIWDQKNDYRETNHINTWMFTKMTLTIMLSIVPKDHYKMIELGLMDKYSKNHKRCNKDDWSSQIVKMTLKIKS